MMKQPLRIAGVGVAMTFFLGVFAVLNFGCGAIDTNTFLGLKTCDILNCDGLFFGNLADDHVDDADDHDINEDQHDDDGDDDHADDADDHADDAEEPEEHTHG